MSPQETPPLSRLHSPVGHEPQHPWSSFADPVTPSHHHCAEAGFIIPALDRGAETESPGFAHFPLAGQCKLGWEWRWLARCVLGVRRGGLWSSWLCTNQLSQDGQNTQQWSLGTQSAHSHLPWHFLASLPGQPVLFLSTEFLSHCLQFSHTSDSPTPS